MSRSDALGAYVPTDWDAEGGGFDGDVSTCADLVRRAKKLAGVVE